MLAVWVAVAVCFLLVYRAQQHTDTARVKAGEFASRVNCDAANDNRATLKILLDGLIVTNMHHPTPGSDARVRLYQRVEKQRLQPLDCTTTKGES